MADIVNLRRMKKANRAKHGVAKPVRDLAKARDAKAARDLDSAKLDPDKDGA
jgi:hypothetical protein